MLWADASYAGRAQLNAFGTEAASCGRCERTLRCRQPAPGMTNSLPNSARLLPCFSAPTSPELEGPPRRERHRSRRLGPAHDSWLLLCAVQRGRLPDPSGLASLRVGSVAELLCMPAEAGRPTHAARSSGPGGRGQPESHGFRAVPRGASPRGSRVRRELRDGAPPLARYRVSQSCWGNWLRITTNTLRTPVHHTIWGDPHKLFDCIVAVRSVSS